MEKSTLSSSSSTTNRKASRLCPTCKLFSGSGGPRIPGGMTASCLAAVEKAAALLMKIEELMNSQTHKMCRRVVIMLKACCCNKCLGQLIRPVHVSGYKEQ
mmetsp:Transcript_10821/g.18464  ORF Transcript_10821/g.18464 Transcript_10821/m.18464 type:complete len:101 (+) Transcript_10821:689-991(+)